MGGLSLRSATLTWCLTPQSWLVDVNQCVRLSLSIILILIAAWLNPQNTHHLNLHHPHCHPILGDHHVCNARVATHIGRCIWGQDIAQCSSVYFQYSSVYFKSSSVYFQSSSVYIQSSSVYLQYSSVYIQSSSVYLQYGSVYFHYMSVYIQYISVYFQYISVYFQDSSAYFIALQRWVLLYVSSPTHRPYIMPHNA